MSQSFNAVVEVTERFRAAIEQVAKVECNKVAQVAEQGKIKTLSDGTRYMVTSKGWRKLT